MDEFIVASGNLEASVYRTEAIFAYILSFIPVCDKLRELNQLSSYSFISNSLFFLHPDMCPEVREDRLSYVNKKSSSRKLGYMIVHFIILECLIFSLCLNDLSFISMTVDHFSHQQVDHETIDLL